jgi:hypothetical protein
MWKPDGIAGLHGHDPDQRARELVLESEIAGRANGNGGNKAQQQHKPQAAAISWRLAVNGAAILTIRMRSSRVNARNSGTEL